MLRIFIITEGSVSRGLGHVYRSIALATVLRDNSDVRFLTQSDDTVKELISSHGFGLNAATDSYPESLRRMAPPDVVVIDKLSVEDSLAECVKQLGARLVIFGNTTRANRYANVVINAVIGTRLRNRRYTDPLTATLFLEGARYFVLREQFYTPRARHEIRGSLKRVLVIYGGSDPANLTCATVKGFLNNPCRYDLTVCTGPVFAHQEELAALPAKYPASRSSVRLVAGAYEVADLMLESDLVLTSGGVTLFEALHLGVPAIAFFQNDLQRTMFQNAFFATEFPEGQLLAHLNEYYAAFSAHRGEIEAMEIGQGVAEIVEAILDRSQHMEIRT